MPLGWIFGATDESKQPPDEDALHPELDPPLFKRTVSTDSMEIKEGHIPSITDSSAAVTGSNANGPGISTKIANGGGVAMKIANGWGISIPRDDSMDSVETSGVFPSVNNSRAAANGTTGDGYDRKSSSPPSRSGLPPKPKGDTLAFSRSTLPSLGKTVPANSSAGGMPAHRDQSTRPGPGRPKFDAVGSGDVSRSVHHSKHDPTTMSKISGISSSASRPPLDMSTQSGETHDVADAPPPPPSSLSAERKDGSTAVEDSRRRASNDSTARPDTSADNMAFGGSQESSTLQSSSMLPKPATHDQGTTSASDGPENTSKLSAQGQRPDISDRRPLGGNELSEAPTRVAKPPRSTTQRPASSGSNTINTISSVDDEEPRRSLSRVSGPKGARAASLDASSERLADNASDSLPKNDSPDQSDDGRRRSRILSLGKRKSGIDTPPRGPSSKGLLKCFARRKPVPEPINRAVATHPSFRMLGSRSSTPGSTPGKFRRSIKSRASKRSLAAPSDEESSAGGSQSPSSDPVVIGEVPVDAATRQGTSSNNTQARDTERDGRELSHVNAGEIVQSRKSRRDSRGGGMAREQMRARLEQAHEQSIRSQQQRMQSQHQGNEQLVERQQHPEQEDGSPSNQREEEEAVLAASVKMTGVLECGRAMRMDGFFSGHIVSSGQVTVGPSGHIIGDLKGLKFLQVEGKVVGDVVCDTVLVLDKGKILGDVTATSLTVMPEATMRGAMRVMQGKSLEEWLKETGSKAETKANVQGGRAHEDLQTAGARTGSEGLTKDGLNEMGTPSVSDEDQETFSLAKDQLSHENGMAGVTSVEGKGKSNVEDKEKTNAGSLSDSDDSDDASGVEVDTNIGKDGADLSSDVDTDAETDFAEVSRAGSEKEQVTSFTTKKGTIVKTKGPIFADRSNSRDEEMNFLSEYSSGGSIGSSNFGTNSSVGAL